MNTPPPTTRYGWIQKNRKLLFWIFFAGAFFTGYIQLVQNKKLKNEAAPNGVISLETTFRFRTDTSIIAAWKNVALEKDNNQDKTKKYSGTLVAVAKSNIYIDFFFLLFYTGLAVVIVVWLQYQRRKVNNKWTIVLVNLALLAGFMDIVENAGMLSIIYYMENGHPSGIHKLFALIKSLAAWTKFVSLGMLAAYTAWFVLFRKHGLVQLSELAKTRKQQLYQYRIIIAGIAIFTLAVWVSDQGQDLLVNINASDKGVVLFLSVLFIIALLNWYLAKLFFQMAPRPVLFPVNEPIGSIPEKKISRFLGVATILGPAGAILNALKVTRFGYPLDELPPEGWLLFLLIIFYALIKFDAADYVLHFLSKKVGSKKKAAGILHLAAFLLAIVVPFLIRLSLGAGNHQPDSLICLYWHVLLFAIAFYIFISVRGYYFDANGWFGKKIGLLVLVLAIISSLLFILLNIFPLVFTNTDRNYITLPALQAGVIFYIFLFTLLIRVSQRMQINFLMLLLTVAVVVSFTGSSYHTVKRTIIHADKNDTASLTSYFREWVLSRSTAVEGDSAYPVFLVNTYGGGIRAAAFHTIAVNWLDSVFMKESKYKKSFENYCFSVSGASGGTIGAAIQAAYYDRYREDPTRLKPGAFMEFYQRDFLSPLLVADMGRDFIAGSFSINFWDDRASITDNTWQKIASSTLDIQLDTAYTAPWVLQNNGRDYQVPLLFANTLNVDDGLKGICAPLPLSNDDFPASIFIRQLQDSLNANRDKQDSAYDVSLITGSFLSARFPYLSPSGKMGAGFHFMDGGGKDNSGAGTSELIFAALGRYSDSVRHQVPLPPGDSLFCHLLDHIRFYFVSINSSAHANEPRQLVENRFEPISPIVGIVNSGIDGNAHAADKTLLIRYGNNDNLRHLGFYTSYFSLFPTADEITDSGSTVRYSPVLPLGWQISGPALRRLEASFKQPVIDSMGDKGVRALLKTIQNERIWQPVRTN